MRKFVTGALVFAPAVAFAAGSKISVPTSIDLSPVYTYAGVLLAAGTGLFAVRKVIKLMNRS